MSENLKQYLDLSTGHVSRDVAHALGYFNHRMDDPFVVVPHGYGAWVHVWAADMIDELIDEDAEFAVEWASLLACMDVARELGCDWISFDCDADAMDGLELHEW